jgi:hypothetical protein
MIRRAERVDEVRLGPLARAVEYIHLKTPGTDQRSQESYRTSACHESQSQTEGRSLSADQSRPADQLLAEHFVQGSEQPARS